MLVSNPYASGLRDVSFGNITSGKLTMTEREPTDRRHINWRLGWIDRRRRELKAELDDLDRQECEVLGLVGNGENGSKTDGRE